MENTLFPTGKQVDEKLEELLNSYKDDKYIAKTNVEKLHFEMGFRKFYSWMFELDK